MTVPIHICFPGKPLPELQPGQMRYVLARNGIYLERRTQLFLTSTLLKNPELELDSHTSRCHLFCPKISKVMVQTMLGFFQAAYQIHGGEAALLLLCNPTTGRLRWCCPEQSVKVYRTFGGLCACDSISFEIPLELPDGYVILGDAHSHGSLPAAPSVIDEADETYKDGLHLIVGHIHRPGRIDYHVDFVMDGHRFPIDEDDILEEASQKPFPKVSLSWLQKITLKPYRPISFNQSSSNRTTNSYYESDRRNRPYN